MRPNAMLCRRCSSAPTLLARHLTRTSSASSSEHPSLACLAGFLFALATGVAGGELHAATALLGERPAFALAVLLHGLLQYLGLFFYLLLIAEHSARVAVTWASVRKAVTVLITFALAGRTPSGLYVLGAAAVFAAGLVERYG
jgi:hypothetical protein